MVLPRRALKLYHCQALTACEMWHATYAAIDCVAITACKVVTLLIGAQLSYAPCAGLPTREQQWLAARISSYLSKVMGRDVKQLPDASAAFAPSRADRDALDMDVFRDHDSDF